jgi:hypothetical protein
MGEISKLDVEFFFFLHQLVDGLFVQLIGHTAIYRANGRTLGLFMKTLTLGTLIGSNVIGVGCDRLVFLASVHYRSIHQGKGSLNGGAIGNSPLYSPFVYRVIGTLGLAGTAVDTFFCDLDGHTG